MTIQVMCAIGNVLAGNLIRRNFSSGDVEKHIRPLVATEEFSAGRV